MDITRVTVVKERGGRGGGREVSKNMRRSKNSIELSGCSVWPQVVAAVCCKITRDYAGEALVSFSAAGQNSDFRLASENCG